MKLKRNNKNKYSNEYVEQLKKENENLKTTLALAICGDKFDKEEFIKTIDIISSSKELREAIMTLNKCQKQYKEMIEILDYEISNIRKDKEFLLKKVVNENV